MLKLRQRQLAELIDARLDQVAVKIEFYLRDHHSEVIADLDDVELRRRIKIGLRRARSWGFETMFGLGLFVALMFEVAPDFDNDPRIRNRLSDKSQSLDERLDSLETALTGEQWEEVASRADIRGWES